MRRCDAPAALPDLDELRALAEAYGITHLGVAPAAVLERARSALIERRAAGLHDGMEFTYRNPERATDPTAAVQGARSIVVGARPYLLDAPAAEPGVVSARVGRYAWTDHYAGLRDGLQAIALRLRRSGHRAVRFADDNAIVDREVAYQAGLGWFGKNANLLVEGAGSWFVLGCVVTDAELPVAAAPVADGCGSCRRCLDACPTGAIVAPGVIDARRCLAWVLQKPGSIPVELRAAIGDRIYGCDDCQEVCPPTVRLGVRHRATSDEHVVGPVDATVDVLALLGADDESVLERWGRWYLWNREPRWLRRNALVVLGNSGVLSPDVVAMLRRYANDRDEMLREHACWALDRLGVVGAAAS